MGLTGCGQQVTITDNQPPGTGSTMYRIERVQTIPAPLERVWNFICRPQNLNRITPPNLHFRILGDVPDSMTGGLIIRYSIRIPGFGRRLWVTEIKHIQPLCSFVDEQRMGPYRFWYHYHRVRPTSGGTEMLDQVDYRLPFGIVGKGVHRIAVRGMLENIFDYRCKRLSEIFPEAEGPGRKNPLVTPPTGLQE